MVRTVARAHSEKYCRLKIEVIEFEPRWGNGLHEPLQLVRFVIKYSQNFLDPHLSASTAGSWPFQVTSETDAQRQKGILGAIVELELHQRIYETDWRILPISRQ